MNQIQKNSSEKIPSFMVQTNMFFLLSKRNLKRNLLKHKWNWSRIILNYYRFNVCIFILKLISLKTPGSYWKFLLKQEHRKWRLVRKYYGLMIRFKWYNFLRGMNSILQLIYGSETYPKLTLLYNLSLISTNKLLVIKHSYDAGISYIKPTQTNTMQSVIWSY